MATAVEQLILAIKTVGLKDAQKELNKLKNEAKTSGQAVDNLGQQAQKTGRVFKGFRGATSALTNTTGQLSVQVQDVAVQLESGTDAVRVFAQQGPQIAAIFGPSGAAFGAILAIGALIGGPFIRSLFSANEAIQETRKELNEFTEGFETLSKAQRRAKLALIVEEMITLDKTIKSLKEEQQDSLDRFNELRDNGSNFFTAIIEISKGFTNLKDAQRDSSSELLTNIAAVERAEKRYEELKKIVEILTGKREEETEQIKKANEALADYIKRQEQIAAKKDVSTPMRLLIEATDLAAEAGRELTKIEFDRVVAAGERIRKIEEEKQARKDADELDKLENQQKLQREKDLAALIRRVEKEKNDERRKNAEHARKLDQAENDLRSKGLLDVEKDEFDSYKRRAETIERYRQQNLIGESQAQEAKANLERQARDHTIKTAGDALNALAAHNKGAFHAAKAFNIAQAIMNTYTGATKALATYPPPLSFIMAGAQVAFGLAQVQTIRAQQFQGRALGGQVRGGESYVVGERGPEILTMGSTGRVIPNDKIGAPAQQVVNRNINVSFQISTVDARGFDSLLQSRKGQIIGMINTAMNERGSRGLT